MLKELKAAGISFDSRTIKKGEIYVAIKGLTSDGHDFISQAIKNGAVGIVGEKKIKVPEGVRYTKVKDSREALGELASEFYGHPSQKLTVIGVTGTKGKTTTCHLIAHILTYLGLKTKLISTITVGGFHTTSPDAVSLQKFLKEAVDEGCKYAVVEVSSHGIDQKRIAGVRFAVGVLTNIAPEHLDYHKTLAQYRRVKLSFLKSTPIQIKAEKQTNLDILPGKFNNLNAQAAVETVVALGFDKKKAIGALQSFKLPEGRLEKIDLGQPFEVYIDFAHTPDSFSEVLTYLRSRIKSLPSGRQGRLIAVFGCAGERDKLKRPKMGKIAVESADFSIFTGEDPRKEDILAILKQMGRYAKNYVCIPERGEAIAYTLNLARKGDVVVVLGKGHEKSMCYKGFEHPWKDQMMVKNILQADKDIGVIILAGGKGKRMKSSMPKVLHEICGRPMLAYTLENLRKAQINEIVLVVGFKKEMVLKRFTGAVKVAVQDNPAGGTADAAKAGFDQISDKIKTLVVINGDDSAFYRPETIKKIIATHLERQRKLTFVSLIKDNPFGLGRVIRGKNGLIIKVVEEKDATDAERKIKEVNDGLYVFDKDWFGKNINKIKKGPQGEYYLVDMIKLAIDQKDKMATYTLSNDDEWQGINTPEQLAEANKKMEARLKR